MTTLDQAANARDKAEADISRHLLTRLQQLEAEIGFPIYRVNVQPIRVTRPGEKTKTEAVEVAIEIKL